MITICGLGAVVLILQRIMHNRSIRKMLDENRSQYGIIESMPNQGSQTIVSIYYHFISATTAQGGSKARTAPDTPQ